QIAIPAPLPCPLPHLPQPPGQNGSDDGHAIGERGDRLEELAEEEEDGVELEAEAGQGPAEQDEQEAGGEAGGAAEFLPPQEEEEGAVGAEEEGRAGEEEDLVGCGECLERRGQQSYTPEPGTVGTGQEADDAAEEEEAACEHGDEN
ncbi:hypothetical protein LTR66_008774, partial [Elasticomyces elasticus]